MSTIRQKLEEIKSGKLTAVENVMKFSEKIATPEVKDLNIFLHLNENAIEEAKAIDARIKKGEAVGKLAGICFALKSNISYKGMTTNCGSKVLENYVSPYNATVVNKLLSEDAVFIGMVNMDEFACGASGETSAFGPTKNPTNPELIPGGTSSGSAAAIAADLCDFTLGSDTGGSIRVPGSMCGVVGMRPSYGLVSRYGLIDMCMSFDTIGPVTRNVEDSEYVLDIIKGQDHFDTTTSSETPNIEEKGVIGYMNISEFVDKEINDAYTEMIEKIKSEGNYKLKEIQLPLEIGIETYYLLLYIEFYSATRKFDGRRFGLPIDTYGGPEVQRRMIGGSEITKAEFDGRYYHEALKARNFIKKQFEEIFKNCDGILLPVAPKLPHKIGETISTKEMYYYDLFTVLVSIASIPGVSVPMKPIDGKEVGMQVITPRFHEPVLYKIARECEAHARS